MGRRSVEGMVGIDGLCSSKNSPKLWSWTLANSPEFVEVNIFYGSCRSIFRAKIAQPLRKIGPYAYKPGSQAYGPVFPRGY